MTGKSKLELVNLALRLIYLFKNGGRNGIDTTKSINDEFNAAEEMLRKEREILCGCKKT